MTIPRIPNPEPVAERAPIAHAPETVLTIEQVADWLQLSVGTVEKLPIRSVYVRGTRRRYLAKWILDWLENEAA